MCAVGDIIFVRSYISHDGKNMNGHPFIVVDDQDGQIRGLDFDIACTVMSSLDGKSVEYRERKLIHQENLEFSIQDGNTRDGFIKADQVYLFNKNDIQFRVIGSADPEFMQKLLSLIIELKDKGTLDIIIKNL